MEGLWDRLGLLGGVAMPLFNLPLIYHIWKRKSSSDLSLTWVLGVWSCIVLMLPAALLSSDGIFRVFGILNAALFSCVVLVTLRYRRPMTH